LQGYKTTAAALSFACWLLSQYQDIQVREREYFWSGAVSKTHLMLSVYFETCFQEKVLMEQREIFGDSDSPPTYRDIQEMKYLEMVIKEALRLYPSIPVFGRKLQKDVDVGE
jgi:cytochrome P450